MKPHVRRAVAFVAGQLIPKNGKTAIYDYDERKYFSFSGEVSPQQINAYDYDENDT
jgi:hypothetical protein